MKKLIIIAIVMASSTQLFAQNNTDKFQYSKEGLSQNDINTREAFIKSAIAEEARLKNAPQENTNVKLESEINATNGTANTPVAPVSRPKTDLELRLETITQSGTPVKR